ncbi:MAG: lytic transglycosylase domain-containing protein [Candidatus Omnitrophota bacterium]
MLGRGQKNDAKLIILSRTPYQQNQRVGLLLIEVIVFIATLFFFSAAHAEVVIKLQAIKTIESSGNPNAFNFRTRCYGLYQISEICLRDFNRGNKTKYEPKDLFNPLINEMVASWYFKRVRQMLISYKIPVSVVTLLASYNWGIGNVVRWYRGGTRVEELPGETRRYIKKYQELTRTSMKKEERKLSYLPLLSYAKPFSYNPQLNLFFLVH